MGMVELKASLNNELEKGMHCVLKAGLYFVRVSQDGEVIHKHNPTTIETYYSKGI